jgi:1,4-alpha-glucan branching enzyme
VRGRDRGALALVLHTHMPYVEGFGTWPFGEEWLWEAVATVYIPLLDLLEQAEAPLTLGLTPVLCDQLETLPGPAGDRLLTFLHEIRAPVHAEDSAALERSGKPELAAELRRAAGDYMAAAEALEARRRDLLGAFARLARDGPVELWTSSATHALLPLLATDAGVHLQLATGTDVHERRFGSPAAGLWLAECAYEPGLEHELAQHGVRYTCVDQTGVHGMGAPEHLEPVLPAAGVVAVPIDWQTLDLVWGERSGYPTHPLYRDYHRRTVHDLRPWCSGGGPYRPELAASVAREHARDFVSRCVERLDAYARQRGRPGLLCVAMDTELLGHWWYEGQRWLRAVLAEAPRQGLDLVTVGEGIDRCEPVERTLAASTWGTGRDLSTWDSPPVAELAFAARRAELRTVAAADRVKLSSVATTRTSADPGPQGSLERAARELLAMQASDWAFQVTRHLAPSYARERAASHGAAHAAAMSALAAHTDAHDTAPGSPPQAPPVASRVSDPAVRNLAPDLELSPLLAR